MNEATLTPMQRFCLTAIRREGPLMTSQLITDLRTMATNGVDMDGLDAGRVIRTLDELAGLGLVEKTLGGWRPGYPAEVVKPKQREMFA